MASTLFESLDYYLRTTYIFQNNIWYFTKMYSIVLACTLFWFYFVDHPEQVFRESVAQEWNDLRAKSEAHGVIVTSYLNCRIKRYRGSQSECQMLALNYGKAIGFDNYRIIFNEIVDLSGVITQRKIMQRKIAKLTKEDALLIMISFMSIALFRLFFVVMEKLPSQENKTPQKLEFIDQQKQQGK